jgi:hypothetical protein
MDMSSLQSTSLKLYDGKQEVTIRQPSLSESFLLYNILRFQWLHIDLRKPQEQSVGKGADM